LELQQTTIDKLNGDIRDIKIALEEASRAIESKDREVSKLKDDVEYRKNSEK
jgi:hypothetical protein